MVRPPVLRLSHPEWGSILPARRGGGALQRRSVRVSPRESAFRPNTSRLPADGPVDPGAAPRVATVNDKRPVNLALGTIQFPLPAIASVLHRISGFALFGLIPAVLWAWQQSLASPEAFACLTGSVAFKVAAIVLLAGLVYHLLAGIKHLFMDIGIGETLAGARALSVATLAVSAVIVVLLGVWVW